MFLGSMLSNMFGLGGFMGDILGLIANVVLIGIVVMIIMAIYRKLFGKKMKLMLMLAVDMMKIISVVLIVDGWHQIEIILQNSALNVETV